jgi:hypothetical protein
MKLCSINLGTIYRLFILNKNYSLMNLINYTSMEEQNLKKIYNIKLL